MFNSFLSLDVAERMNQKFVVIQDNIQQRRPKGIDVDFTKTIFDGQLNKRLHISQTIIAQIFRVHLFTKPLCSLIKSTAVVISAVIVIETVAI